LNHILLNQQLLNGIDEETENLDIILFFVETINKSKEVSDQLIFVFLRCYLRGKINFRSNACTRWPQTVSRILLFISSPNIDRFS